MDQKAPDWLTALFAQVPDNYQPEPAKPIKKACPRCGGAGRISGYSHIKGGECFKCHGSGLA